MPTETISDTVTVRLDEIIDTDREGFLDLLDTLVNAGGTDGPGPLSDISYRVVDRSADGESISILVIAKRETNPTT